jgi:hypothetical protein
MTSYSVLVSTGMHVPHLHTLVPAVSGLTGDYRLMRSTRVGRFTNGVPQKEGGGRGGLQEP